MTLSEITTFMGEHAGMGWVIIIIYIIFYILEKLSSTLPILIKIKTELWIPIARRIKFKFIQKKAIKSNIQGRVNNVTNKITSETFSKNLKPLEIEWISSPTLEHFIQEDKILVRLKPIEKQEYNLINVVQPYLESILLPRSNVMIEQTQKKAILYFATSEIVKGDDNLEKIFHDEYYLPECNKHEKIEEYFKKIKFINEKGMFFSTALTAIEIAAENNRYITTRLSSEFSGVLNHLVSFIENLNCLEQDKRQDLWDYKGTYTTYGLLLVARPVFALKGKTDTYVKRAKEHLDKSKLLFVLFTNQEKSFGNEVAKAIEEKLDVIRIDELISNYDYRGASNGIVKIYKKKE